MLTTTPYSEEAERAVLGSIIVDSVRVFGLCADFGVTAEWFQNSSHRTIFEHLYLMPVVDTTLLIESLRSAGDLEQAGGASRICEIIDATPTASHAEHYISILETNYRLKKIAISCTEGLAKASEGVDPAIIASELSNALTELSARSAGQSTEESMHDNITVLENAYNGITSGIPLPWEKLTGITGGVQRGAVVPLVGRDGKGKSGALAQIIDFWAGINVPTLVFSLEDVKRRVLLRMGGNREFYSARTVETGKSVSFGRVQQISRFEKDDLMEKMIRYKSFLSTAPVWVHDEPHTVEQICDRVRHYKRTKHIKAVTIDGFKDIVYTKGKTKNEAQEHISKRLCAVAKECDVSVLVVSHIRKTDDKVAICKQDITGASEQFQGARQVLIFQDAGIDGIDGQNTFLIDCCKANFTTGAETKIERDENVLTYREID